MSTHSRRKYNVYSLNSGLKPLSDGTKLISKKGWSGVQNSCNQCENLRYTSVKQGDSWEPGSQNTERKQKRSTRRASTNEHHKSPMHNRPHLSEQSYYEYWKVSKIFEQESDKF